MRSLTQFVLVVSACLLIAATAHAQPIDACVMNNGLLKVLDEGGTCLPQETPIELGQPQQPAVETVRVFDGEGRDVGTFVDSIAYPRFASTSTSHSQKAKLTVTP